MSTALATTTFESRWSIVRGAMAGTVRVMSAPQFTIGRSPECEFVILNDPKCSRRHAAVQCSPAGCEIVTLTDKNIVMVNGKEVARAHIKPGDVITIGETDLQFTIVKPGGESGELSLVRQNPEYPAPFTPAASPYAPQANPARPRKRASAQPAGGGIKRLIIYGVIAAVVFWFFSSSTKKKEQVKIRTEQQMQADIDAAKQMKDAAESAAIKRIDSTVTARQAQENYVRGFRDYRDGQYERALVSFQACLALNPEHVLCTRYLRLAQRKFNEMVQYNVVLGRKYRDQNQYRACRSAFRNVMVMIKDANNSTYKEAKANYEACNTLAEGRF